MFAEKKMWIPTRLSRQTVAMTRNPFVFVCFVFLNLCSKIFILASLSSSEDVLQETSSLSSFSLLKFDDSNSSSEMERLEILEKAIVASSPKESGFGAHENQTTPSVVILCFASQDIMGYAFPALVTNYLYAFAHQYTFKFLHERNGGDYFPEDRRWNKIGAVIDAIESQGWGQQNYSVIVTHDADLIFTDFSFDVESILAQYPKAHVLISADAFDIANSGFIIIRNTKWSYQFFLTWYSARYAHECDQHALNDIIEQMKHSKAFFSKFKILPKGKINSMPPLEVSFDPQTSHVLHLFGLDNAIRKSLFSTAANTLLQHYLNTSLTTETKNITLLSRNSLPPKGLGLTGDLIGRNRRDHLLTQRQKLWTSLQGRDSFLVTGFDEYKLLLEQLTSLDVCTSQICEREMALHSAHGIPLQYCDRYTRETIELISQVFHILSSTLPSSYTASLSSLLTQALQNQWKVHRTVANGQQLLLFLQHLLSTLDPNLHANADSDADTDTNTANAASVNLLALYNTRYRLAATALDMSFLYGQQQQFQAAKEIVEIGLSVSSEWISSAYLSSPSPTPQFVFIHLSLLGYYGQYLLLSPARVLPTDAELAVSSARRSMAISSSVYRQIHAEKMTFCDKTLDIHISGLLVLSLHREGNEEEEEKEKREVYEQILDIVRECNIVLGDKRQMALEQAMGSLLEESRL